MNLEGNDFVHIPLDDGDPNGRLVDLNLYSGYKLIYNQLLEGGGVDQRRDFLYIISKIGKPVYQNALEWCAGPGIIGYELLGFNKTKKISFMDLYKPALDNCLESAVRNNVTDKVTVYLTDKISNINTQEKFDLVVGNPPHAFDFDDWSKTQLTQERPTPNDFPWWDNQVRIDVDRDMMIHKEFFDNIRDKITDDADIFISETGLQNDVIAYAKSIGFEFVASWVMRCNLPATGYILHFRPKFSGFVL